MYRELIEGDVFECKKHFGNRRMVVISVEDKRIGDADFTVTFARRLKASNDEYSPKAKIEEFSQNDRIACINHIPPHEIELIGQMVKYFKWED